ncbi:hypothetical protein [Desulfovibrio piger]|uniref:hypothetical protein n=1 Tax=Desulfovibrio piger TaxID=901 RepID=UPI0026F032B0|nr:hypothetical protein [Desulfovibrio piger]
MSDQLDFFTPVVPENAQHNNFKSILKIEDSSFFEAFREFSKDFTDRDGKIVKEFQTTFNSAFWEIYLHRLFSDLGYEIVTGYNRPDFLLKSGNNELAVEAVIANNACGAPAESSEAGKLTPENLKKIDLFELNKNAILRYCTSIVSKYKKYDKEYKQLEQFSDKPFIIALGSYDQPAFFLENDRAILPVLYGLYVDEQNKFDGELAYQFGPVPVKKMPTLKNKNGSDVPLRLFANPDMKKVSAVVFSCMATINKVRIFQRKNDCCDVDFYGMYINDKNIINEYYSTLENNIETIEDGLCVFHNPFAECPVTECFRYPGITNYTYDIEREIFIRQINTRQFVFRASNSSILNKGK